MNPHWQSQFSTLGSLEKWTRTTVWHAGLERSFMPLLKLCIVWRATITRRVPETQIILFSWYLVTRLCGTRADLFGTFLFGKNNRWPYQQGVESNRIPSNQYLRTVLIRCWVTSISDLYLRTARSWRAKRGENLNLSTKSSRKSIFRTVMELHPTIVRSAYFELHNCSQQRSESDCEDASVGLRKSTECREVLARTLFESVESE